MQTRMTTMILDLVSLLRGMTTTASKLAHRFLLNSTRESLATGDSFQ